MFECILLSFSVQQRLNICSQIFHQITVLGKCIGKDTGYCYNRQQAGACINLRQVTFSNLHKHDNSSPTVTYRPSNFKIRRQRLKDDNNPINSTSTFYPRFRCLLSSSFKFRSLSTAQLSAACQQISRPLCFFVSFLFFFLFIYF